MEPEKQPHNPAPGSSRDVLHGATLSGAMRINLEHLDINTVEFARSLAGLCLMIHNRKLAILSPQTRAIVEELDLFEWSEPYPKSIIQRGFPFYKSDRTRHETINNFEADYKKIKECQASGREIDKRLWAHDVHPNTPWDYHFALAQASRNIDEGMQDLRRRAVRGISVPEGRIRPTDFGEDVIRQLVGKPLEIGAQVVRVVLRAEELTGKTTRLKVVEHIGELWKAASSTQPNKELRLRSFDRHLRKLGIALLEGSLPFNDKELELRGLQITAEGHVDTYLAGTSGRMQRSRHAKAYEWLQDTAQHCPLPYPSWQPRAKQECFDESFKVVMRARHQSYHSFNRLRMENRALGSPLSLFREFALDAFEDVRLIRGDNLDMPPGRGTLMSGARLDRLFFDLGSSDRLIESYERNEGAWFADALSTLESSTVVALRGWIGVTSDAPLFTVRLHDKVEAERYYYIVDNDHFSGSYGFAYGIPSSVVARKLLPTVYDLDDTHRNAYDIGKVGASIPALIEATIQAGKVPLKLGGMSPLFGGMCNAIPSGVSPVFSWENREQDTIWRDLDDHVHWSWLVWNVRDDRTQVNNLVRPLQVADHAVREFATAGQKLFEVVRNRYAAWKNDQTPGERTAPRMLMRAYDIYHEHRAAGQAAQDQETIFLALSDRSDPVFKPTPILNCHTLELKSGSVSIQLPKNSDGSENAEALLWRKHVKPLIESVGRDGVRTEGVYELVLIGEKDLR